MIEPPRYVWCLAASCQHGTEDGKPYCPRHVARMPYAREVIRRQRQMRDEVATLRARGEVNVRGELAAEVLFVLRGQGPLAPGEVARQVAAFRRDASLARQVLEVLAELGDAADAEGLWVAT